MTKKEPDIQLVKVEWVDALSKDGWYYVDEAIDWAKKPFEEVVDVGWLLKKTKTYILLSPSFSNTTNQFDYIKKIPLGIIKRIYKL